MKNHIITTVRSFVSQGWKPALLAIAGLALAVASSTVQAGRNFNPGIMPPQSHAYGMSYGDWGAAWWQWALGQPAEVNPLLDPDGGFAGGGQAGPVWFLAGSWLAAC